MQIGVGRIVLDFFNNEKVSLKHRKLEELCAGLRKKFNISALEVAEFEDPEKCVIAFAAVIPDTWKTSSAESLCEKICKTIDDTAFARVMDEDWELVEV